MTHGGPAKRKANKNIDGDNMIEEFPAAPDGGWGKKNHEITSSIK